MPNVRIALVISWLETHLCAECFDLSANQTGDGKLAMPDHPSQPPTAPPPRKPLSPAAQRALAEAEACHAEAALAAPQPAEKEFGGPKGPEPTRYGDWENKGIASDF
jgi:hypothetical protein